MLTVQLRCLHGHQFEGWYQSEEDYYSRVSDLKCPICDGKSITRTQSLRSTPMRRKLVATPFSNLSNNPNEVSIYHVISNLIQKLAKTKEQNVSLLDDDKEGILFFKTPSNISDA